MYRLTIIFVLYFTLALGLILQSCTDKTEQTDLQQKIPVKTAPVIHKDISIPIYASGKLMAAAESKLSFKIAGIVNRILVNKGERVKKGQLLAQLDLVEMNAGVKQAQSAYDKTQRDFERVNNLFDDSVATLEQYQNAETGLEISGAALKAAKFNLKYSKIHAPSDGKILHKFAEEHELIGAGMPLFLFGSDEGSWVIKLGVTDREIVNLQVGDSADVFFDAYPKLKFFAQISELGGAANPMTGTFEVKLKVEANTARLFSGFVAKVTILPQKSRKYSLIPAAALFEATGDEGIVFHVKGPENQVKKINVIIDNIIDGQLAVSEGLEGVEQVITDGAPYLRDGSEILIVNK